MRSIALTALVSMVVLAAGCGGSGSNSSSGSPNPNPTGSGTPDVTIQIVGMDGSNSFSPNPGMMNAGQTVAWHNADVITHTATANNDAFDTGAIAPGTTSTPIKMSNNGSFAYHCSIHPTMTGTLQVNP